MDKRERELGALLDDARRQGARGAEVLVEECEGIRLEARSGKVVERAPIHSARAVVRAWVGEGQEGVATGAPDALEDLIAKALKAAETAEPNPLAGPVSRLDGVAGGLGIFDRRHDQVGDEDRTEALLSAEASVRDVSRGLVASGFTSVDQRRLRLFGNSKGIILHEHDTTYEASGSVTGTASDGELTLTHGVQARTFASIASLPFGTQAANRVNELLADGDRLDGPVRVMMPPLAVASLFARVGALFSYEQLREGFCLVTEEGSGLSPRLHLLDDGGIPGGFRTRSFDDRGARPLPLTLIRDGRVEGRFLGQQRARALKVPPTGHQHGDALQPTNLILRSGTRSMNAMLSDLGGEVFQVDDFPDLSGLDPVTGDMQVKVHGQVIRNNTVVGAMRNVNLCGNLREVLSSLVEVASNTDRHGHVDAPGMLVDGFYLVS